MATHDLYSTNAYLPPEFGVQGYTLDHDLAMFGYHHGVPISWEDPIPFHKMCTQPQPTQAFSDFVEMDRLKALSTFVPTLPSPSIQHSPVPHIAPVPVRPYLEMDMGNWSTDLNPLHSHPPPSHSHSIALAHICPHPTRTKQEDVTIYTDPAYPPTHTSGSPTFDPSLPSQPSPLPSPLPQSPYAHNTYPHTSTSSFNSYLNLGTRTRRISTASISSSSSYSPSPTSPSSPETPTRRRTRPCTIIPTPIPVPNLTKKSRGRRVPTAAVLEYSGTDRSTGRHPADMDEAGSESRRGARMYMCKVTRCGKCFARGEHLKRHVRSIHTFEKPHKCPYPGCGKDFSRHDNLGQHMRVHKDFVMPKEGLVSLNGYRS